MRLLVLATQYPLLASFSAPAFLQSHWMVCGDGCNVPGTERYPGAYQLVSKGIWPGRATRL